MKKSINMLLCAAVIVLAVGGCKKKEAEETIPATEETTVSAEIPQALVELGAYMGISMADPYVEVTDEELEARIKQELDEHPLLTEVDRPAENGDVANIDYVGMKDGVPFDRGADDNYDLELGSNTFIDGFEEGLVGAKAGDELSLNLTFPENYGAADLAGQDVVFDVTVNAVKEKTDAELNDEFVKRVSKKSKTVEEYREELRAELEEQAREFAQLQIQNDVMEKVIENATFTGLEEQVEAELNQELASMESALSQQGGTLEEYAAMYNMTEEDLREQMRLEIENVVQINLVTDAVAEKEGLKADDDARQRVAELNGMDSAQELISQYGQEAVDQIAKRIRVMEYLAENAKVE